MIRFFAAISLCICAVLQDLHTNRIPNVLCACGAAAGLLLQIESAVSASHGDSGGSLFRSALCAAVLKGTVSWLAAVSIPLILGFLLHRHNLMGAGDTKLLAALCGISGYESVLPLCALSLITGAAIALFIMIFYAGVRSRLGTLAWNVREAGGLCPLSGAAGLSALRKYRYNADAARETSETHGRKEQILLMNGRMHFSIPILCAAILYAVFFGR